MTKIRNSPVALSIISTFVITALWMASTVFGQSQFTGTLAISLVRAIINIAFAMVAVFLLGRINQINGLRHVFNLNRLGSGLFALLPVTAFFLFGLTIATAGISSIATDDISIFPIIAFNQLTSAFMQNVIFRGLLITALFIKLSGTQGERVKSIFKASALYLVIYILLNILNGNHIEPMQLANTFIVGAGFCAAYMYSKNLLSLILVQSIWQIADSAIETFGVSADPQFTPLSLIAMLAILISIVVFAIKFSKRAEPFIIIDR